MLTLMTAGAKSIAIAAIKANSFGILTTLYMRSPDTTFNLTRACGRQPHQKIRTFHDELLD